MPALRTYDLLIGGGAEDPNILHLAKAAERHGLSVLRVGAAAETPLAISWDLKGPLMLGSALTHFRAAFVRHDVFAGLKSHDPHDNAVAYAWYNLVHAYISAQPSIAAFNRAVAPATHSKPMMLVAAHAAGLTVPETVITNDLESFAAHAQGYIAKPIGGGDYCQRLSDAIADLPRPLRAAPNPAIVQKQLSYPEYRVFIVGGETIVIEIASGETDYRTDKKAVLAIPKSDLILRQVESPLRRLCRGVGVDFGAADFKTNPETGQPVFLELNTAPMFARFDAVVEGRIAYTILNTLLPVETRASLSA